MKVTIFASILVVFSGLVSSVPAPDAPMEVVLGTVKIHQDKIVTIHEDHPDHKYGYTNRGQVSRKSGSHNIQSLISMKFTQGYPGRTCKFSFWDAIEATGSKKVQLFTVGGPVTDQDTFNSRPYRNNYLGAFNAVVGGEATWDSPGAPSMPCPTGPITLGFECVPQNDDDKVTWDISNGLIITVV